jgi:hypothetical protein
MPTCLCSMSLRGAADCRGCGGRRRAVVVTVAGGSADDRAPQVSGQAADRRPGHVETLAEGAPSAGSLSGATVCANIAGWLYDCAESWACGGIFFVRNRVHQGCLDREWRVDNCREQTTDQCSMLQLLYAVATLCLSSSLSIHLLLVPWWILPCHTCSSNFAEHRDLKHCTRTQCVTGIRDGKNALIAPAQRMFVHVMCPNLSSQWHTG